MAKIKDKYLEKIVGNWLRDGSLADLSGKGNTATLSSGSTYWVNTARGRVPDIDGVATEITIDPANTSYNVAGVDFSLSCWVYLRNTSAFSSIFGRLSTNEGWRFYEASGNAGFSVGDGTATSINGTINTHRWVFLTGTHNESTGAMNFYINGVFAATGSRAYVEDSSDLVGLGTENNGGSQWMDGYIQDAIIWKGVEFTGAEVAQLYEEGLQEAHYDSVDIKQLSDPARNLLPDGDMEAVGVADYVVFNNASLAKETDTPHSGSQYLKVNYNGTAGPGARINDLVQVGKTYRFRGWAKSDGTWNPQINDFGGIVWQGTTSTSWQYFDFVKNWTNTGEDFILYSSGQTSGYTAWDDITIQEVPNVDDVYIANGKGWNETFAAQTTGFLSNTDWELNGVTTSIINISGNKAITTNTGGIQTSRPSKQAYGTWEFKVGNGFANFATINILHSTKHGSFNDAGGYNVSYRDDGSVRLRIGSTTLINDTTTRVVGTEVAIKITRTAAGLWELFVDGVSIGTATDNTYTTSNWCTLDLDQANTVRDFRFLPYIE